MSLALPEPGQTVRVRSRRYVVEEVVPAVAPDDDARVVLLCLEEEGRGETLEVLWEREVDAALVEGPSWNEAAERGLDAPGAFLAMVRAHRFETRSAAAGGLFYAPSRSAIELMPYQLEPLAKARAYASARLFLADGAGLGKTIEAGLVIRELLLANEARSVLVVCPPSVVLQWQGELEQRFGLSFAVYDRAFVAKARRVRGFSTNPFATHSRFVVSSALLKDEGHFELLRAWRGRASADAGVLVLDEAHAAAPGARGPYAPDSRFGTRMREVTALFEHRLFLSGTPHDTSADGFAALLEMLDPRRFCRGVAPSPRALGAVFVRRTKEELRRTGVTLAARRVVRIDIGPSAEEPRAVLARWFEQYRAAGEARLADAPRGERARAAAVFAALERRLLSSIEAFAWGLLVHGRAMDRSTRTSRRPAGHTNLEAPGADDDRAELSDEELRAAEEADLERESEAALQHGPSPEERELLARMIDLAERSRNGPDARVTRLAAWVREHCLAGRSWNERRVLIFVEYADTKRALERALTEALGAELDRPERIATLHGGLREEGSERVRRAFESPPDEHPLRLLVATDAAREGLNLQSHCADLFHFDIPWNPARIEQRAGRLDRKLQRAPEVRCHHFVHAGCAEDEALDVLARSAEALVAEGGATRSGVAALFEGGIRPGDPRGIAASLASLVGDARGESMPEPLRERIAALDRALAASEGAIGFGEEAFARTLDAAVSLAVAAPLSPVQGPPATFTLPPAMLEERSFSDAVNALRRRREPFETIADYRARAPVRRFVLRDTGARDEHTAHVSLDHPLSRRLLARLREQGSLHADLVRVTAVGVAARSTEVVLLGMLTLYGANASRLHQEIVAVSGLLDTSLALSPGGARFGVAELEGALDTALPVPARIAGRLAASASGHARDLAPRLAAVVDERVLEVERALGDRERSEIESLDEALLDLSERLAKAVGGGASLSDVDAQHCRRRLETIEGDRARVRRDVGARYTVRTKRVEPLGLVYLWQGADR